MAHNNMIVFYSQIPVYNAFFELLKTQNFKKFLAPQGQPW